MSNQNQSSEEHTGPTYIVAQSPKSLGIGLIATLILGPIGLLYVTVRGGIIMIIVDIILAFVGLLTLGFSLFITVPLINLICVAWAYVGIKRYNEALMSGRLNI